MNGRKCPECMENNFKLCLQNEILSLLGVHHLAASSALS
jgi:hypothetical protein